MAVCAGITYNATTHIITVAYVAADGTKGASFTNPYTFQDVYDTDVANGWGECSKQFKQFVVPPIVISGGSLTYFADSDKSIFIKRIADGTGSENSFEGRDYTYIRLGSSSTNKGIEIIFQYRGRFVFSGVANVLIWDITNRGSYDNNFGAAEIHEGLITDGLYNITPYSAGGKLYKCVISGNPYPLSLRNDIYLEDCFIRNIGANTVFAFQPTSDIITTIRRTKIENTGGPVGYIYVRSNSILNLVDCNLMGRRFLWFASGTKTLELYLKTVFKATLKNAESGQLQIKANDGTILFEETLTSDSMTSSEVVYERYVGEAISSVLNLTTNIYSPLRLEVIKIGYDTLVIPDIYITEGLPTTVYGEMIALVPEPPSISSLQITNPGVLNNDGSISIIAESGTQPYMYSINGGAYQEDNIFENLEEGTYSVSVKDANDLTDSLEGVSLKKTTLYNQSIVATINADNTIVTSIIPEENIVVSITTEDVIIA